MGAAWLDGLLFGVFVGGFGLACAMIGLVDTPGQAELYAVFVVTTLICVSVLASQALRGGPAGRRFVLPIRCARTSRETADNGFVLFLVAGCAAATLAVVVGDELWEPAFLVVAFVASAAPIRVSIMYGQHSGVPRHISGRLGLRRHG